MESSNKILRNISRLIDKLMLANERLKRENGELLSERERLTREKTHLMELVEDYRRKEKVRDIYTSFVIGEGDKLKAKSQLEKILREIDGCINTLRSKD